MIISDIKYHMLFVIKLDPPMTDEMESALTEIYSEELEKLGASLEGLAVEKEYHTVTAKTSPETSPAGLAVELKENVSRRVIKRFNDRLGSWGSIYAEPVMIKSGQKISRARVKDFLKVALQGF